MLGLEDGNADGFPDGLADGAMLGLEDGKADGFPDGLADGAMLGLEDGNADGFPDGLADGATLGLEDGNTVGFLDGFADGATLGLGDGDDDERVCSQSKGQFFATASNAHLFLVLDLLAHSQLFCVFFSGIKNNCCSIEEQVLHAFGQLERTISRSHLRNLSVVFSETHVQLRAIPKISKSSSESTHSSSTPTASGLHIPQVDLQWMASGREHLFLAGLLTNHWQVFLLFAAFTKTLPSMSSHFAIH